MGPNQYLGWIAKLYGACGLVGKSTRKVPQLGGGGPARRVRPAASRGERAERRAGATGGGQRRGGLARRAAGLG